MDQRRLKINAGCGRHILDGYCNIDAERSPLARRAPDIIADVRSIPLADGCADELMAIHVFEHFYEWEVDALLAEWRRLIRPGGLLVLEMPDVVKAARNLIAGSTDQLSMWGLYGDPRARNPLMCHKWGWTFATLAPRLAAAGFDDAREARPQWHRAGADVRDFRVEAIRR